ncbi:MAG: VWA domain-containing protein, partial [Gammaproteobacteria bacterium]|nr:VWA domain-containing protein [Gammaproteobacteria bacterium]
MVTSIRTLTAIGFGMVISLASPAAVHEPMARPLLMPGKQSLYQRVLARPGAVVSETAVNGSMASRKVIPFSVYYVYARKGVDGTEWVQVGSDSHGTLKGWIRANQLIKWNQALTVAFREPVGRERVLLFRDRESLKKLVDSRDVNTYDHLYRQAEEGKVDGDSPVIAIQPRSYVDIKEDFYLVPIQRHEDVYLGDEQARMLQVTSVPLKENRAPVQESREYRSGLVFVIDSTVSMGPYIDRTKEVVKEVYSSIAGAGLEDKVSFGMVAYRDNVQAAPRLGYLAKTYASLEQGRDAAGFFRRVKSLKPASVSSQDFVEDAYAGVKQAIEEIDWRGNDARYIVLVTDAGARVAKDPLGRTGMDADALRQLAHDKGISIWVLHLLTPEGSEDHSSAASQYQRLSYYPGIGNFYYGVTMGKVAEFGRVLDALASQITEQVGATAAGTPPLPVPDRVKRKE